MRAAARLLLPLIAALGCAPPGPSQTLSIIVDAPAAGQEAYTCFGFAATPFLGQYIESIEWTPPSPGPVVLHHASLFAVANDFPDGPVPCETMPAALTLHVWGPGSDPLRLPPDTGLELPADTRRVVIQAHILKLADAPPAAAHVTLKLALRAPAHVAGWLGAVAPVPAIPPHLAEASTALCSAAAPFHVFATWPHMHRVGHSFHGEIVHADGTHRMLVDVPVWDFGRQLLHPASVDVVPGDAIQTTCTWQNDTDSYVFPGLRTTDEMCGQGLLVWPLANARWAGACP